MVLTIKINTTSLDPETGNIWRIATQIEDDVEIFRFETGKINNATHKYLVRIYGPDYMDDHNSEPLDKPIDFFDYISDLIETEGKLTIVAHSIPYVKNWLMDFYKEHDVKYHEHFHSHGIDTITLASEVCKNHRNQVKNLDLHTVALLCDIPYQEKDIEESIRALSDCYDELISSIRRGDY